MHCERFGQSLHASKLILSASGYYDVHLLADFILTFQENPVFMRKRALSIGRKVVEESEEDVKEKVRQRKQWRDSFLAKLHEYGMDYEEQDPNVSVHSTVSCSKILHFLITFFFFPLPL